MHIVFPEMLHIKKQTKKKVIWALQEINFTNFMNVEVNFDNTTAKYVTQMRKGLSHCQN